MTIYDAIAGQVTARDAAVFYGLKFGRNGRACCPWHDDHNPDLTFYGSRCYCHACHSGGDAVALTARVFGLSMWSAARKLNADFRLKLDMGDPLPPATPTRAQVMERERQRENRQYGKLCDVEREADERLRMLCDNSERFDPLWDDPRFTKALEAMSKACLALENIQAKGVN